MCIILMTSSENSVICDPFSGSNTTGIATNLLGRKFIGIDKEDEFIKISLDRKRELDQNLNKFKGKISDLKLISKINSSLI